MQRRPVCRVAAAAAVINNDQPLRPVRAVRAALSLLLSVRQLPSVQRATLLVPVLWIRPLTADSTCMQVAGSRKGMSSTSEEQRMRPVAHVSTVRPCLTPD